MVHLSELSRDGEGRDFDLYLGLHVRSTEDRESRDGGIGRER